jgi:hypothetical protein
MEKGWKPMPVILKIIWIILIVNTFFAVLAIAGVYSNGFDFLGIPMYGMYAINVFFLVKIVLPVVLIVGMHQRYRWIWMIAAGYYFLFAINAALSIMLIEETSVKVMEQVSEIPQGIDEESFVMILRMALILSFIFSTLFNLAVMIFFIIKRKYFQVIKHQEPPPENELPS